MSGRLTRSWVEIDTEGVLGNLAAFRTLLAPQVRLMTVVKANAYGHGLAAAAPAIAGATDWFGVDSLDEGLALHRLSLERPVLILGYVPPEDAALVVECGFSQALYREDVARALSESARRAGKRAPAHIKVETGTHRQGVPFRDLEGFVASVLALGSIDIEGVYTHFANIEDTLDPSFAMLQLERFRGAVETLDRLGVRPTLVHAAASAGALLYPETHFNLVRVGIGAYGVWPSRETQLAARERGRWVRLNPVLAWKTRVAQVKTIDTGDYVGYGLTFQAPRPMKVAVVPVGYYDGYDRKLSSSGRALVRGQPAPVVGRVAMNMMMLDVTATGAAPDEEVVLLGKQGTVEIRVEEIAEKVGTIPYEVLARIHPALTRVARGGA